VAAAKTPPPVAVGSPPLSSFYMLLSIVNTHLCCAAVLPVFSPIIYVITYSDGKGHPTGDFAVIWPIFRLCIGDLFFELKIK
jgi:hypothetical protein